MSKIDVHKNDNYISMSITHLQDQDLSLKAKGLMSVMLSLPKELNCTINKLSEICNECKNTVITIMKELKEKGYLSIEKKCSNENGANKIDYIYHLYEQKKVGAKIGCSEIPKFGYSEIPKIGISTIYNIDSMIYKEKNIIYNNNIYVDYIIVMNKSKYMDIVINNIYININTFNYIYINNNEYYFKKNNILTYRYTLLPKGYNNSHDICCNNILEDRYTFILNPLSYRYIESYISIDILYNQVIYVVHGYTLVSNNTHEVHGNMDIHDTKNIDVYNTCRIPTIHEVREYIKNNNYSIDYNTWYEYYKKRDFKTKKGKLIDNWKGLVDYWEKTANKTNPKKIIDKEELLKSKSVEEMTNEELDIVFNHNPLTDPRHKKYHSMFTDEEIDKTGIQPKFSKDGDE